MFYFSLSFTEIGFYSINYDMQLKIYGGEMDYRFHAAHLDRGLTIHEAVPGGFNRAGEGL